MTGNRRTRLSLVAMLLVLVLSMVLFIVPATAGAGGCCRPVGTPGFYKKANHWPEPVQGMWIGGQWLTKAHAIDILKSEVAGDKCVTMFKAYIAAWLNTNSQCDEYTACIWPTMNETAGWLTQFCILHKTVEASSEAWQYSHGEALYWTLDDYNNGLLCAEGRD